MILSVALCCLFLGAPLPGRGQAVPGAVNDARVREILEPIRQKSRLPALAAALVTEKGLDVAGAVGRRKAGADVPVTIDDLWHLGSDTKAMTAAMIGSLVEEGILKWETTAGDLFPELPDSAPAALKKADLRHFLSHRSGLPANLLWGLIRRTGSPREQRLAAMNVAAGLKIPAEPPAEFLYSNLGYVVAAAMAEKAADADWEDLVRSRIFEPLGMTGAGFGGTGTPGLIDQPWPHTPDGAPKETNGPETDNPPVIGPAGIVHCRLADWARFIADQLRGRGAGPALLKKETYLRLHTPPFAGDYALGWVVVPGRSEDGVLLAHDGSNGMNYAMAVMAPDRGYAVLVVTNQGGESANRACSEAAAEMVRRFRSEK
jgi:CubicO group peptidase (beta-lactamase class C family)